jgi:hypothetical protein
LNTFTFCVDQVGIPDYSVLEHVQKLNMFRNHGGAVYIIYAYVAYLAVSISMTVWVARTLERNGRVFLVEALGGNTELADSVNRLLVVGFYLLNIGYVSLALRTGIASVDTARQAIELISEKIGLVLLVLGALHFGNIYIFNRMRRRP